MVNLGIIGLGPHWESRYLPALKALGHRIRIRAIYDAVYHRACLVADQFSAEPARGLHELLRRNDVRGVLVFNTGWQGLEPLRIAVAHRKPAFMAGDLGEHVESLAKLHLAGLSIGLTLMPELANRYVPATHRMLELTATQIGPPREIHIDAVLPAVAKDGKSPDSTNAERARLVGLVDWCRHVTRTTPASVQLSQHGERRELHIEFRPPRGSTHKSEARLTWTTATSTQPPMSPRFTVQGTTGWARMDSPHEIVWQTGENKEHSEALESERSDVEVVLDHFCRRVVGGLIPVADLADVCSHMRLITEAHRSVTLGRAIRLSELT